jgi:hypothetical protein
MSLLKKVTSKTKAAYSSTFLAQEYPKSPSISS